MSQLSTEHNAAHAQRKHAVQHALRLLKSPRLFNEFLVAVTNAGLVGEEANALVLFIVEVSRVLPRPLNLFVKGQSSAGKNWLVTRTLRLMPKGAVAEITSASDKAWHYSGSDFRHRVLYVQERNEAAGRTDPIRLLISEKKLVRIVTKYEHGKLVAKKYVARGPVAAISTTTKNRLEIDDETRHLSIWVDESSSQTRNIVRSYTASKQHLRQKDLRAWHMIHWLLEQRIATKIVFPPWFEKIADHLFVDDLRVRRYFPAFVEACRTVCLIRSFQPHRKRSRNNELEVEFADFAIAALIFDRVFVESLHLSKSTGEETRRLVEAIVAENGKAAQVKDVARELGISLDRAYAKLRYAKQVGVIRLVNRPEQSNRKTYVAMPRPRFLPDPEKLFQDLEGVKGPVRFVHPITGEWIVYKRAG